MARPATGSVVERKRARGTVYALRFRAYGERRFVTLGDTAEGWSRARAETELSNVLADVRRGIWRPPAPEPVAQEPRREPTFHEFASEWFAARQSDGLAQATIDNLEWSLTLHLLPHFAGFRLSEITVEEVDRYRRAKVAEGEDRGRAIEAGEPLLDGRRQALRPLSASSVNKTLKHLAAVLDQAMEYGHITSNPAKGRRRRLKAAKPRPVFLDGVDQMQAMLDAARELDREGRTSGRYALIATLLLAGPRVTEACELAVRDVDLAGRRIEIGRAKSDAGMRRIDMLPLLLRILMEHERTRGGGLDDPVFVTAAGTPRDKDNVAKRVIGPVVRRADELLAERGEHPLPRGVTAHKLRHSFATVLVAIGRDPRYVMDQLGHEDPGITMRIYTHALRLSDDERARLRAFVNDEEWAPSGTTALQEGAAPTVEDFTADAESAV